jgi:N-acetylneuraminate lyase
MPGTPNRRAFLALTAAGAAAAVADRPAAAAEAKQAKGRARFGGVWPAMVTPLTADGKPSFEACEKLVDLFVKQGLGGIYLTGSTGQWPSLTVAERKGIAECVLKAAGGRLPVMVHAAAATTADAVDLAKHAARTGAAAVASVGPTYFNHSTEATFEYFARIGAATDLPLFVYHLTGVSNVTLSPRAYVDKVVALPNAAGMKVTTSDLAVFGLMAAHAGDRLRMFSGADQVLCPSYLCGAIGAIGTYYNLWGPEAKTAWEATAAGDVAGGRAFTLRLQSAIADVNATGGRWGFLRAAMRRRYGIEIGMPRPPLGAAEKTLSDADVERLLKAMG